VVKLRLKRFGRRNRPYYRLCAIDLRKSRDSSAIEELGHFDPIEKQQEKALTVKADRIKYWLSVGAQPSQTVRNLLAKAGVIEKPPVKIDKRREKRQAAAKAAKEAAAQAAAAPAVAAAPSAAPAADKPA
jgi:small subunit ribosomal protein S16